MIVDGIEIKNIKPIPPMESTGEKDVFTFFGLAAFTGQCLEKGLVLFAMSYKLLDENVLEKSELLSICDSLNSKTFGRLLNTVKSRVDIPEPIIQKLDESLEKRNWLVHHFFHDRAAHFADNEGRKQMIKELGILLSTI